MRLLPGRTLSWPQVHGQFVVAASRSAAVVTSIMRLYAPLIEVTTAADLLAATTN